MGGRHPRYNPVIPSAFHICLKQSLAFLYLSGYTCRFTLIRSNGKPIKIPIDPARPPAINSLFKCAQSKRLNEDDEDGGGLELVGLNAIIEVEDIEEKRERDIIGEGNESSEHGVDTAGKGRCGEKR